MTKQLITILIILLSLQSYSQTTYKKGYVITNSGEKIECLIRDLDWNDTPTKFEYKLNENANVKTGTLASIKEFMVAKEAKYIRFKGDIDRSTDDVNKMRYDRSPVFKEEQLFLKVLVEGKANLYEYQLGSLKRYFYKIEKGDISQLVYKKYKVKKNLYGENVRYKQQLWNNLKCSKVSLKEITKIAYKRSKLVNFFIKHNECNNSEFVRYQKKRKKGLFSINIRPGINNSSLSISNNISFDTRDFDFGNKLGLRLGVELEYVLPFNNNKWSISLEPTYKSYKTEGEFTYLTTSVFPRTVNLEADYSSIEFPTGIRYYSFINDNSKLFFNALLSFEYVISSSIESSTDGFNFDLKTSENLLLGAGYTFKNKFSAEFRLGLPREGLSDDRRWSSDFKNVSLILGYTIFNNKNKKTDSYLTN